MTWKGWFLLLILLNALDAHSTMLALKIFGLACEKPNLLSAITLAKWGIGGMIIAKAVALSLIYGIIWLGLRFDSSETGFRAAKLGLKLACGLFAFVVISNYFCVLLDFCISDYFQALIRLFSSTNP